MYALQHLKISVCDTAIGYGLLLVYCACIHENNNKKRKDKYIYICTHLQTQCCWLKSQVVAQISQNSYLNEKVKKLYR